MKKLKIKKNDEVQIVAGKDRGGRGKVLRVFPSEGTALVERVNMVKRHTRPNPSQQIRGGVLEREAPIQLSNLKLICPECGQPTRVGRTRLETGMGMRTCKRCEATFN